MASIREVMSSQVNVLEHVLVLCSVGFEPHAGVTGSRESRRTEVLRYEWGSRLKPVKWTCRGTHCAM